MLSSVMVSIIFVFMFASCVPELKAVDEGRARLRVSYIVQPDRINVPHDRVEEYGYNIWGFQNDNVTFSVYLTNFGNTTAENVTATLRVPEESGFNLTKGTAHYENIESQNISNRSLAFSTNNVSKGFYDLNFTINYQDAGGTHSFKESISLKIVDVYLTKISHRVFSSIYRNETEEDFLSPLDSVILGYHMVFQSNDEKEINVRIDNGGNNLIENITFDILSSPGLNLKVQNLPRYEPPTQDIIVNSSDNSTFVSFIDETSTLRADESREFSPKIIIKDAPVGTHNLTVTMNYSDVEGDHAVTFAIPIGVYNLDPQMEIFCSKQNNTKDFVISTNVYATTPHENRLNITTSDFSVLGVPIPNNCTAIQNAIKRLIEKTFPVYLSNSTLFLQKGDWLSLHLSNSTLGEKRRILQAVLANFGKYIGEDFGGIVIHKGMQCLIVNEILNPAAKFESNVLAFFSGSNYGKTVFEDVFSEYSLIENFMVNETYGLTYIADGLGAVVVPKGELETVTNQLPVELIEISDENTTYTSWDDVVIDDLPMVIKANLTQLVDEFGISEQTVEGSFVVSSSNKTRLYSGYVDNNTLIIDVVSLDEGNWSGVIVVGGTDLPNQTTFVRGISQTFSFTVVDVVPLFELHNFTRLSDFLSAAELVGINNATLYVKDILYSDSEELIPQLTKFDFSKQMNLTVELNRLEISSLEFHEITNTTDLTLVIESLVNLDNVSIIVNTLSFDEKYPEWISYESVENNIGILQENISKQVSISLDGRYGTDFKKFNVTTVKHSIFAVIGVIITVVTTTDWIYNKIPKGKTIVRFEQDLDSTYDVNVGEAWKIGFKIHFEFVNTWAREWIYFEYVVLYDGVIVKKEEWRGPKKDWIKDISCECDLKREMWFFANKYDCKMKKEHELRVIAKIVKLKWGVFGPRIRPWDVDVLKEAPPSQAIVRIHNPWYIEIKNVVKVITHTSPNNVSLSLEARRYRKYEGVVVTVPEKATIWVDPLNDKDDWDFTPDTTYKFEWDLTKTPPSETDIIFTGKHKDPRHIGIPITYEDNYALLARGQTPVPRNRGKKRYEWPCVWKAWFRIGKEENEKCLPDKFKAVCIDGHPVETSNSTGHKTDEFYSCHSVYVYSYWCPPNTTLPIYVVEDTTWIDGMPIPTRVLETATIVTTNGTGQIPPTKIWPSAVTGAYDIIVDVNNDGFYNATIDALDDNDIDGAGFVVAPLPFIESSDPEGNRKDIFDEDESVYVYGGNFVPSKTYDIYVVEDTTWIDGMPIPSRVDGTGTTVTTDGDGAIAYSDLEGSGNSPALIWKSAMEGKYDAIVDVNKNGKYDLSIDALDDLDVNGAGFIVPVGGWSVPINFPVYNVALRVSWITPTLALSTAIATASIMTLYKKKHKTRKTRTKPEEKT